MLVQVNGTAVNVNAGNRSFNYIYGPRVLEGQNVGLNKGLIGVGSQQARGTYDNVTIQVAQPEMTLDTLEDYNDGAAQLYTGATTRTWTVAGGRYVATPVAGATSVATKDADLGASLSVDSYLEVSTVAQTTTTAGIVFDQYAANDLEFVILDVASQRVLVGHIDPRRGYVIEHSDAAEHPVMRATLHQLAAPSIASGVLVEPQPAPLAPNSPATASVITQDLSPRAQLSLAAPAASCLTSVAPASKSSIAPLKTLLLRGIAPARASLIGMASGRVSGFDAYLAP